MKKENKTPDFVAHVPYDEMVRRVVNSSAMIKLMCGVGNNAAHLVMLRAYEHAKQCESYKRDPKQKQLYKKAFDEWNAYENRLIYAKNNRMFHVADMTPKVRRKYGDITDREYYEFWSSIGSFAYKESGPLLTSLWNKCRLPMVRRNVPDAEHYAWLITAKLALHIAVNMYEQSKMKVYSQLMETDYERSNDEYIVDFYVISKLADKTFGQFSIERVLQAWRRAMNRTMVSEWQLDETEQHNIDMGIQQLAELWASSDLLYRSTMSSVDDYEEVFATMGFKDKTKRELSEVRTITNDELKKLNK